jgi:putative membrane protein
VAVLPTLNALLNATAGVLLVLGVRAVRRGDERLHKRLMLSALGVSAAFLASYLWYHFAVRAGQPTRFVGPAAARAVYLAVLGSHTLLAAVVPFLALRVAWLGLKDRRGPHRRLARWTYPVWLYVSATGVAVYLMLYVLWPAGAGTELPVTPPAR